MHIGYAVVPVGKSVGHFDSLSHLGIQDSPSHPYIYPLASSNLHPPFGFP